MRFEVENVPQGTPRLWAVSDDGTQRVMFPEVGSVKTDPGREESFCIGNDTRSGLVTEVVTPTVLQIECAGDISVTFPLKPRGHRDIAYHPFEERA